MKNIMFGFVLILAVIGVVDVSLAAFPQDTHIINLYLLDEGNSESGALNNADSNSFIDSAVTGTPQNHANAYWPAPMWGSGSNFAGVGTGTGLIFSRVNGDQVRVDPWTNVAQGDYADGLSFTIMFRIYATSLTAGSSYGLFGTSSNYIKIEGVSGDRGKIMVRMREGAGGGETNWYFDSFVALGGGVSGSGTGSLTVNKDTWYNLFIIYDADNSITVATDDGTTFNWIKTSNVPSDFSTVANGFSDSNRNSSIGNMYGALDFSGFDGRIESVAIWDKALTTTEADGVSLRNVFVTCENVLPGYHMSSDLNSDCKVNFEDFAMLASNWAGCNDPEDTLCQPNW